MSNYPDNMNGFPNHLNPMYDIDAPEFLYCDDCGSDFEPSETQVANYMSDDHDMHAYFCRDCDPEYQAELAEYLRDSFLDR